MTKGEFLSGIPFTLTDDTGKVVYQYMPNEQLGYIRRKGLRTNYYCCIEDIQDKGFRGFTFLFNKKVSEFIFFKQLIPIHEKDRVPGSGA